jgi:hypothetical protein
MRRGVKWALVAAVVGAVGSGGLVVAVTSVSAAGPAVVCAPVPNPSGTGYWTPFGDATWTANGLLTSSQPAPSQPYGVTCGGAAVYGTALPTSDPNAITAASFDFNPNQTGPSFQAPRLVICFSDGQNCDSNANIYPSQWTAGTWTHFDAFAAGTSDTWNDSGGSCSGQTHLTFSAVIACHPGATVTEVAVVNDGGSGYPAGEQVLLNNLTLNGVVAHDQPPVMGKSAEVAPLTGSVLVKQPGSKHFLQVKTIMALHYGATVNATGGDIQVIAKKSGTGFESGEFYDGGFNLSQGKDGIVQAALTGRPTNCPTTPLSLARDASGPPLHLWGHVHGKYKTRGHYGSASVQGTIWLTEERCDGTFFRVVKGVLRIRDFTLHKTVIVRAGHSYLAPSQPPDTFDNDGDYNNDRAQGLKKHG